MDDKKFFSINITDVLESVNLGEKDYELYNLINHSKWTNDDI